MFLFEKIDKLVLITIEDEINADEVEEIVSKLENQISMGDEIVASFDLTYMNQETDRGNENRSNLDRLLEYCHKKNIKIHFYSS